MTYSEIRINDGITEAWTLDDPDEFVSSSEIRCPECGATDRAADYQLWENGADIVYCASCDATYQVEVYTSRTYTSRPAPPEPDPLDRLTERLPGV